MSAKASSTNRAARTKKFLQKNGKQAPLPYDWLEKKLTLQLGSGGSLDPKPKVFGYWIRFLFGCEL
eukprot:4864190-Prymnesium_polylepis.1